MKRDLKIIKYPCGCIAIYSKSLTFKAFRNICMIHQRILGRYLHKDIILEEFKRLEIIEKEEIIN